MQVRHSTLSESQALYSVKSPKAPFAKLPHTVALDHRLSADSLALLAYRATFTGNFRALAAAVKQLGIGRDRFYAILHELMGLGYVTRSQGHDDSGDFVKVGEAVNFDAAPAGRAGFQIVPRSLFGLGLPAKAIGLLLYARAHAQRYALRRAQVCTRFGWSDATAKRYAKPLREAGLLPRGGYREGSKSGSVKPGGAKSGGAKSGGAYNETSKGTKRSKTTNELALIKPDIIAARFARDDFCEGRPQPDGDVCEGDDIVAELRQADHARVLDRRLFTAKGRQPLLAMIEQHGQRVMQVVRETLTTAARDGWPLRKIKSWNYFPPALATEAEAEAMEAAGIRPGDVLGDWRDLPMHRTVSASEARPGPPEHSRASEAYLAEHSRRQEQRWRPQRPQSAEEWRELLHWLLSDAAHEARWDRAVYGKLPGEPGCWVPHSVLNAFGGPALVGELLTRRVAATQPPSGS